MDPSIAAFVMPALTVAFAVFMVYRSLGGNRKPGWASKSTAIDGQATLVALRDTGTQVNHQPQLVFELEVRIPGVDPYPVSLRRVVGHASLGSLQPGLVLAVKVHPDDHDKVWMDFDQPATMGAPGSIAGGVGAATAHVAGTEPQFASQALASDLIATGTPGWATITGAQPLGMTAAQAGGPHAPGTGDDPLYVFEVQVHLDGGSPPYAAQFGHRVPKDRIATLAVGTNLRVAVDPSMPTQKVAIDWDAA